MTVIAVVMVLAWFWAEPVKFWFRVTLPVKRAERQIRSYTPPTTMHVVYDDDPQTYPQLLAGPGGYVSTAGTITGGKFAAYDNAAFDRYVQARGGGGRLYILPVAFLHERISPKGNRRIIAVQISMMKGDPRGRLFLYPSVADSVAMAPTMSAHLLVHRPPGPSVRVYDGVIDPNDSSQFSFVVEVNGQRMDVRGQLLDNDRITLTPAVGQVADFHTDVVWAPPGVSIPPEYEPSCFVDIATTRPTQYLLAPRGFRERIDENGMLVREDVKSGRKWATTAPALPPGYP